MASAERTIVVEQDSSSDNTDDEGLSSDSDGDEVVISTQYPCQATIPGHWTCPSLVQHCPYHQHVHPHRQGSPTQHGRHHGRKRGKENHGDRRHDKEHGHGRQDTHDHDHSEAQGQHGTEGHHRQSKGHHHQSEGHHHGTRGHNHGSKGHHRGAGHPHHGDGHRSRHGAREGRHGRRHGSCSSEDGSDLILKCADVHDFKQEEVKVTVSGDTVNVKAVSNGGEMSRVFKVTKEYDISKVRVSRSYSGVLTLVVPAKDAGEKAEQDTTT